MQTLRALHVSAVDKHVVEIDEPLRIEGAPSPGYQNEQGAETCLERSVECACRAHPRRLSSLVAHTLFFQTTRPSLASWWQMPDRSAGLSSGVSGWSPSWTWVACSQTASTRS